VSEMKLVIVIRNDVSLRGDEQIALAAQAVMDAFDDAMDRWGSMGPDMVAAWRESGREKFVAQADSEIQLRDMAERADNDDIGHAMVALSGSPPAILALGPDSSRHIDRITGDLERF